MQPRQLPALPLPLLLALLMAALPGVRGTLTYPTLTTAFKVVSVGLDSAGGYGYFGSNSYGSVFKTSLTTGALIASTTLNTANDEKNMFAVLVDPNAARDAVYYATYSTATTPVGTIVKVQASNFSRLAAIRTPAAVSLFHGPVATDGTSAFWATATSPGTIAAVNLPGFTFTSYITLASGENSVQSMVWDSTRSCLYAGTGTAPGIIVKVATAPALARTTALTLLTGEDNLYGGIVDAANAYAYFGTAPASGTSSIVKITLSSFTRAGALATTVSGVHCAALDSAAGFAYWATLGSPAQVVKVALSSFTSAAGSPLTLQSGENSVYECALDVPRAYLYLPTYGASGGPVVARVATGAFIEDIPPTPSGTPTIPPSASGTPPRSATASLSRSGTATPAGTGSKTGSGTPSNTPTGSPAGTPSAASTKSGSSTGTPSATTASGTPSSTPTHTRTPSNTVTHGYVYPTPSITDTSSRTPAPTPSNTRSASASPSNTGSGTPSSSVSKSESATATGPPSGTPSASDSASASATPTRTRSGSGSPTGTPPGTASATGTPSNTGTRTPPGTPSATLSATRTPSTTPTHLPVIVAHLSATVFVPNVPQAAPSAVVVSDAWPPMAIRVSIDTAPAPGETVSLSCAVAPPPGPQLDVEVAPLGGYVLTSSSAPAGSSFVFTVSGLFNASAPPLESGQIGCSAVSGGSSDTPHFSRSSPVAVSAVVLHAHWPLLQDVIMHFEGGITKSAWAPQSFDSRQALSDWCGGDDVLCPGQSPDAAIQHPGAVAYLMSTVLANIDPIDAWAAGATFAMTLSGATRITLVADAEFWGPYGGDSSSSSALVTVNGSVAPPTGFWDPNTTTVSLGGLPCNVSWVAGNLMQVVTPPLDDLCDFALQVDCGFKTLAVTQGNALSEGSVAVAASYGVFYEPAVTAACPPVCPGMGLGVIPYAVPPPDGPSAEGAFTGALPINFTAASVDPLAGVTRMPPPPSSGVYFTSVCASFTNPLAGDCVNTSSPLFSQCAWGSGDSCRLCPVGGMCPGGARVWPLVGYWVASEASFPPVLCASPATLRCAGWNASTQSSACGTGYRAGSYRCLSCDAGYFAMIDGSCGQCPAGTGLKSALQLLFFFTIALLLFGAVNYAALVIVSKYAGGTVAGGAKRSMQLMVWTFTVIQTIVSVGKGASGSLPPLLTSAYTGLDVFQFAGIMPNAACLTGVYPFSTDAMQMGLALGLLCLICALQVQYRRVCACARRGYGRGGSGGGGGVMSSQSAGDGGAGDNSLEAAEGGGSPFSSTPRGERMMVVVYSLKPLLRRVVFTVLTLMFPIVCKAIMDMLYCQKVNVSVKSYLSMNNDGSTLVAAGISLVYPLDLADPATAATLARVIAVNQLAFNPYYVCNEAAHAPMAYLAWVTLVIYALGYPLGTWYMIRRRIARVVREGYMGAPGMQLQKADSARMRLADLVALGSGGGGVLALRNSMRSLLPGGGAGPRGSCSGSGMGTGSGSSNSAAPCGSAFAPPSAISSSSSGGGAMMTNPMTFTNPMVAAGGGGGSTKSRLAGLFPGGGGESPLSAPSHKMLSAAPPQTIRSPLRPSKAATAAAAAAVPANASSESSVSTAMPHTGSAERASSATSPGVSAASFSEGGGGRRRKHMLGGGGGGYSSTRTLPFGSNRSLLSSSGSSVDGRDIASMTVTEFVDSSPELLHSQAYAHFTSSDFRPSCFYFRQMDMAALFVLSCLLVFWANPPDNGSIVTKMIITLCTVLTLAVLVGVVHPFPEEAAWKYYVKIGSLCLAGIAAVLNCLISFAARMGANTPPSIASAINGLALLVFVLCIALFVTLISGFWYTLMAQGSQEQKDIVRAELAQAEAVAMTQGSLGARLFRGLLTKRSLRSGGEWKSGESTRMRSTSATSTTQNGDGDEGRDGGGGGSGSSEPQSRASAVEQQGGEDGESVSSSAATAAATAAAERGKALSPPWIMYMKPPSAFWLCLTYCTARSTVSWGT